MHADVMADYAVANPPYGLNCVNGGLIGDRRHARALLIIMIQQYELHHLMNLGAQGAPSGSSEYFAAELKRERQVATKAF